MAESHCENCVKGGNVAPSTNAKGTIEKFDAVDTYVVRPAKKSTSAILIVTDIFGVTLPKMHLVADAFTSATGFLTVAPDLFNGDSFSPTSSFAEFPKWVSGHGYPTKIPIIEATIKHLREKEGIQKIGIIGYCYGGKISIKFGARPDQVQVYAAAHPASPDAGDIEAIQVPGLYLCAETDQTFGESVREAAKETLHKKGVEATFKFYPGTSHGFAIRDDENKPLEVEGKKHATEDSIKFFAQHLA